MTTILVCWLIGVLLPYIWAGASVPFRNKQFGSLDLSYPRLQAEQMTEGGAGAWGAQGNAWEALIVFSVANSVALTTGVDPAGIWSTFAVVWVIARVLHGLFYVTNKAPLRVACFLVGLICSLGIFVQAFRV